MSRIHPAGPKGSHRVRSPWPSLLLGPLIGYGYFWFAYLLAEASCNTTLALLGPAALLGTTIVALVILGLGARREQQHPPTNESATVGRVDQTDVLGEEHDDFVRSTGRMLLGLFALFVVAVTVPLTSAGLC